MTFGGIGSRAHPEHFGDTDPNPRRFEPKLNPNGRNIMYRLVYSRLAPHDIDTETKSKKTTTQGPG